ncbi:MAG: hypothetical protein ACFFDF_06220 [Candidatus Odinarchaeota archaeon]
MGKEKEKDKEKDKKEKDKDKEKDKEKEKKDKKEKDKEKEKKDKKDKEKEKDKDKDKKDKDKEKDKEKVSQDQEWKLVVSKNLDSITHAYEKITNKFRDIDNYILKDAKSKEDFIEKVKKTIEELPEASQEIFRSFIQSIE